MDFHAAAQVTEQTPVLEHHISHSHHIPVATVTAVVI